MYFNSKKNWPDRESGTADSRFSNKKKHRRSGIDDLEVRVSGRFRMIEESKCKGGSSSFLGSKDKEHT